MFTLKIPFEKIFYLHPTKPHQNQSNSTQLSSTKPKQIQANPTKPNHTQINSINQPNSTQPNPGQVKPNQIEPNPIKPKPHLNRFNRTQSNPTYRAKPNQIHQDITQSYTSLDSPTQPGTTFYHPTRQRLHTALRN